MAPHDNLDSRRVATTALSVDRKLDEIFENYKSEIGGALFYLYAGSENASKTAYEKLRERCRRYYENSNIGDLHAWVFRILYNLAYESVGNMKANRRKLSGASTDKELSRIQMKDEALIQAQKSAFEDALFSLRFSERAIFLLRLNGGLSYEQIARATGFSEEEVKSQMKMAIKALAKASDSFAVDDRKKKFEIVAESDSNEVKE